LGKLWVVGEATVSCSERQSAPNCPQLTL
jgi:hypothetical protein